MSNVYLGGIPYAPIVKRLEEKFPLPSEGQIITHEELEVITGETRQTGRYYAVCDAWIKKLLSQQNIHAIWEKGKGIKILPPAERLEECEQKFKQKIKQTGRVIRKTHMIPSERLDEIGQKRLDHVKKVQEFWRQAAMDTMRKISIELAPVRSLPKLGAGENQNSR